MQNLQHQHSITVSIRCDQAISYYKKATNTFEMDIAAIIDMSLLLISIILEESSTRNVASITIAGKIPG